MKYFNLVFLFALILVHLKLQSQTNDFTKYINPMIGTGGHGHVFPGPTMPFGKVQLSPDNRYNFTDWDWCSGYHYSDTVIVGFSHTHLSGTGVSDLGDILITPYIGKSGFENEKNLISNFSHQDEKAEAGYYKVFLKKPQVTAELTASNSVGFHQYTFPASDYSKIIIDANHKIYNGLSTESQLKLENDSTISGYRISTNGWAKVRKIYFVIKFSKKIETYTTVFKNWENKNIIWQNSPFVRSENVKMEVGFKTKKDEKIKVKVSISMVDLPNALDNQNEIQDWDFEKSVNNAKKEWNNYISKIKVDGDETKKTIFYTAMYHALIAPNQLADTDGRYTGPDYNIHKSKTGNYYSTFSLWDTYRGNHPLYTIIIPSKVKDMVNSMVEHYNYNGYLPMWTLWGTENHCMIANHAIPVITDAYLKGIVTTGGKEAFEAMKVSSTIDHPGSPWLSTKYDSRGYYACNLIHESVSRTLESAYNDWCVAQMARLYGTQTEVDYFLKRSNFYKNIFNPTEGLMWPKDENGNWLKDYNPSKVSSGHVTEGNSWQYNWSVQHDPESLFALYGTKQKAIQKLDSTFLESNKLTGDAADVTGLIGQYAHGNEPSHHIAYLYNYLDLPKKTQFLINKIRNEQYRNNPNGLTGNEDCGQMSAWYILSSMGFYPVNPASGVYNIGTPAFSKVEIMLENGKSFIIKANNLTEKNVFIKSIKLNGKELKNYKFTHQDIVNGGNLDFEMTSK